MEIFFFFHAETYRQFFALYPRNGFSFIIYTDIETFVCHGFTSCIFVVKSAIWVLLCVNECHREGRPANELKLTFSGLICVNSNF